MNNILLAAGSQKSQDLFRAMLSEILGDAHIISVSEGDSARLRLKENEIDLVVVNTPMADEQGVGFAVFAADPVVLVTNQETYARAAQKLEEHGIIAMKRPVEKKIFSCAVRDAVAVGNLVAALRKENRELKESIEESKLVSRAKGMLMSQLRMTEAQAHRYIEKQAMDLRVSKKTVSQSILKTYYNR